MNLDDYIPRNSSENTFSILSVYTKLVKRWYKSNVFILTQVNKLCNITRNLNPKQIHNLHYKTIKTQLFRKGFETKITYQIAYK